MKFILRNIFQVLVFVLCATVCKVAAKSASRQKQQGRILADAALFKAAEDPFAKVDTFAQLTPAEKSFWASEPAGSLEDKIKELEKPLEMTTSVEVKLVGFSGDGQRQLSLGERELGPYLEALKGDIQAHVLKGPNHTMPITTKFVFRISSVAHHLTSAVQNAIHSAVDAIPDPSDGGDSDTPVMISYRVVDDILAEDFHKSELSYTLYLLNPVPAARRYLYLASSVEGADGSNLRQGGGHGCATPLWTSRERYLWIDLTAGPSTYGPHSSGAGVVLENTLPRPELPRYNPASTSPKGRGGAGTGRLVSDMVSLIRDACTHLFTPPAAHPDLRFHHVLIIQVVRIVDRPMPEGFDDAAGLGLEVIRKELEGLSLGPQNVRVRIKTVEFGDCDYCVAAYMRGLTTTTSTGVVWKPPAPKGPAPNSTHDHNPAYHARVHQHLDSAELHAALQELGQPGLWNEAGIGPAMPEYAGPRGVRRRTLPVYLFDLNTQDQMLLDRHYQVVPFDDMVLAVRTQGSETLIDYKCGGEVVLLQPHAMNRPLLGGLLHSVWGVSPTAHTWDVPANQVLRNHLWDTTMTPFGPASVSTELSFVQRDAAMRNLVWAQLNATLSATRQLFTAFAAFNRGETPLQHQEVRDAFTARWNVLQHKLARASRTASIHNFNISMYFALSAAHEVGALSEILHTAAQEMHSTIQCFQEPQTSLNLYQLIIIVAAGLLIYWYLYTRRKGPFKTKRF